MQATIMILADDERARFALDQMMEDEGYHAISVSEAPMALSLLDLIHPDVIVLELGLKDSAAVAFLKAVREHPTHANTRILAFARADPETLPTDAQRLGVQGECITTGIPRRQEISALLQRLAVDQEP
jgi:DNA-binding response OmpR family regulator